MQVAGHDIERWFAVITGAGAALFTIVKLAKAAWRGFWTVTRTVVGEVVDPKFAETDSKVDDLSHYTQYHLGPNDTTMPIHRRIARMEVDNATIKMRQLSQHRENKESLTDMAAKTEKVAAMADKIEPLVEPLVAHVVTDVDLLAADEAREAQRRSREDQPPRP